MYVRSAGYEHIYEYIHHIVGQAGKFSGAPMHMGHFHGQMDRKIYARYPEGTRVRGFFHNAQCREFLTTGVCLWMLSMPDCLYKPCCSHDVVGGDGTHIGIPVANALHLQDIWRTNNQILPVLQWGAADRYLLRAKSICAPLKTNSEPYSEAEVQLARTFMSNLLDSGHDHLQLGLEDIRHRLQAGIATPYVEETMRWLGLVSGSAERAPVRLLLKGICSKASASHMLFDAAVTAWDSIATRLDNEGTVDEILSELAKCRTAFYTGGLRSSDMDHSSSSTDTIAGSTRTSVGLFDSVNNSMHCFVW